MSKAKWFFTIVAGLLIVGSMLAMPVKSPATCDANICGDGVVGPGEECDDGNLDAGDGCATGCTESFNMEVQPVLLTYSGGHPRDIINPDLNNDGIKDLLVCTFRPAYLHAYLLSSNGSIAETGLYQLGSNPAMIASGNLNGDHFADVVSADIDTDQVHVFFGNGDGALTLANIFISGDRLRSVRVGDINNDGFDDMLVGCMFSSGYRIYYGDGLGNFPSTEFIDTGGDSLVGEIYDFNGDGFNDLALASTGETRGSPSVKVYRGGPSGITLIQDFPYVSAIVKAIDLNLDGRADLVSYGVVSSSAGLKNGMDILINQGDGTFVHSDSIVTNKRGYMMDKGDLNNDGIDDLAIVTRDYPQVRVFPGNGKGGFQTEYVYSMTGDNTAGVCIMDLNLDGAPDLVTAVNSPPTLVPIHNLNFYQFREGPAGKRTAIGIIIMIMILGTVFIAYRIQTGSSEK